MRPAGIITGVPGKRDARQRLLDAALHLISQGGPAAASPAAVAARAGASKMSMYRHFDGKDDMLAAVLTESEPSFREHLIGPAGDIDPARRIREMFERLADRADRNPGVTAGCPYVMADLAISDPEHPTKTAVLHHKDAMRDELARLVRPRVGDDAERIADLTVMLLDGALAHARIRHSGEPLRQAGEMAASWVAATAGS